MNEVKNCPFCGHDEFKEFCLDWQNNHYNECAKCNLIFQDNFCECDYSESYWIDVVDPDGNRRDLTKEKDFKIKNWYGGIISYINNLSGKRILDIGCGLGYLLSAIDDRWEKVGFDVNNSSFNFIKKQLPNVSLLSGDIDIILKDYGYNSFDVIVCYHVLEHLDRPVQFFDKICKLLSDKGTLIIGTPNIESFCARRFKGKYRLLGNGHLSMFSPIHLRQLFWKNNLNVVREEYPFFKTAYFTINNILRLVDKNKISPPFYGNIMTFYGKRKGK